MKPPPEVELTISLEKLGFIILKAREFDVKVDPVEADPDASATDDEPRDVLEDYADDPAYEELVDALENLNEDELAEVIALTWLGRGDYEPGDWEEALTDAIEARDPRAVANLVGTPNLADLVEEGLAHLGLSIEDTEREHL
jgi:hypothetical protein